ncbi:trypsin alpha-3-like [Cylas formicarius]|uniref:trypsin alpha-3-like n=1 Tax=Cylas formicarius TaxID=197179 RepID=UPI00295882AE|nr:trypsin alpha-3-like [Cylas formicarius]
MSDQVAMSSVSCVSVTTLVVVSLANLILLIVMLMESRKHCREDSELAENYRYRATNGRLSSLVGGKNHREDPKFLAALVVLKSNQMALMCGATIVSKFWVLVTARCCEKAEVYPFERLKVSSNAARWTRGRQHSVETLVRHVNYTAKSASHDLCLVKVGSPFKDKFETPVALSSAKYEHRSDTLATAVGWISRKTSTEDQVYFLNVNLIAFQTCKTLIKVEKVDDTMICAYNVDGIDCSSDSGGPLLQNNVVIGMAPFEINCAARTSPRVFTRIAHFEKWFRSVENQNGVKIDAIFKP